MTLPRSADKGPEPSSLTEGRGPELLRDLYVERRSGCLHFEHEGERRTLVFSHGCIADASTDAPGAGLGDVMVYDGLLTSEELERTRAAVERTRQPFGVVLEKLGLIERKRLEDVLALYVRETLAAVFLWGDGRARFEEGAAESSAGEVMPSLSTGEIILDAVRLLSRERVHQMLGDLERIPVSSSDPLLRFQRIPLTPTDGYVLSRVDGAMTARQIIELAPAPPEEVEGSLLGLFCTGMIDLVPALRKLSAESSALRQVVLDAFARLQTRNHFEVLGVPPTASPTEVRAAYMQQARLFHPDAQHDPGLADLREYLEKIFARVNEAYDALSHPTRRADYESFVTRQQAPAQPPAPATSAPRPPKETPRAPVAVPEPQSVPPQTGPTPDQLLNDATHLFGEGRYWEVIGLIEGVLPYAEGRTRQRLHLLCGQAYLRQPDSRKQAIRELEAALADDPTDAQAHYLLGGAYLEEGLPKRAVRHLQQAVELRPHYKEAQRELDKLERQP